MIPPIQPEGEIRLKVNYATTGRIWRRCRAWFGCVLTGVLLAGCAHTGVDTPDYIPPLALRPAPPPVVKLAVMQAPIEAPPANEASPIPEGWPIERSALEVISEFGPRGRRGRLHKGIDLKAPFGTVVTATASGVVVLSGVQNGYGNIVVVDHGNGYQTAYAHLRTNSVRKGDTVRKGEEVGRLGNTGRVTTHHLHYEVRYEGLAVDPYPFIRGDALSPSWREYARK